MQSLYVSNSSALDLSEALSSGHLNNGRRTLKKLGPSPSESVRLAEMKERGVNEGQPTHTDDPLTMSRLEGALKKLTIERRPSVCFNYRDAHKLLQSFMQEMRRLGLHARLKDFRHFLNALSDLPQKSRLKLSLFHMEARALFCLFFKNSVINFEGLHKLHGRLWSFLKSQILNVLDSYKRHGVEAFLNMQRWNLHGQDEKTNTPQQTTPPNSDDTLLSEFTNFSEFFGSRSQLDLEEFTKNHPVLSEDSFSVEDSREDFEAFLHDFTGVTDLKSIRMDILVEKLVSSPMWNRPEIVDVDFETIQFAAIMMLGDQVQIKLADKTVSAADIIRAMAQLIQDKGVDSSNAAAAKALPTRMSSVKKYAVDRLGWYDVAIPLNDHEKALLKSVEKDYGREVAKEFFTLMHVSITEFKDQIQDNPSYTKEMKARFSLLQDTLRDSPHYLIGKIVEYRKDPMYKHMGATAFMSMLLMSAENSKHLPDTFGVSEIERVAIYGYTTGDYVKLNENLRFQQGGEIVDPGKHAYAEYVIKGMKKLPNIPEGIPLKRAIFSEPKPGWGQGKFKVHKEYRDFGFASCTSDLVVRGVWNLEFKGNVPAKDMMPFSAFPGEREWAILPGTRFKVTEVNGNNVVLKLASGAKTLRGSLRDRFFKASSES